MIRGIVAAVPKNIVRNVDAAFIKATGVEERRIVTGDQNVVTLAEDAANLLLSKLGWKPESIDLLVFVTQTPIYKMPCMATVLAGRVGINAAAYDIGQACAGYPLALWTLRERWGRILLIAGDTVSKMAQPYDMLFGDCVTATAIENGQDIMEYRMGCDGRGFDKLIANPFIEMDGPAVMNFALDKVPDLIRETTMNGNVEYYLFHQANRMILNHIAKKCKLPMYKVPFNIERYGNCSSASIPLLMCDSSCTETLKSRGWHRIGMFGFGAGWSWAGCLIDLQPLQVAEVIES